MLKLMAIALDYGACTHIRIRQVMREISRQSLAKTWMADADQNMQVKEKILDEGEEKADLIWFGRSVNESLIKRVKMLQGMGKKILFDLDDFMLQISPWSAHYDVLGQEEVYLDGDPKKPIWKDKVEGFDLVANRIRLEQFKEFLTVVGAISVTTPRLMERYKPYTEKIYVFPNTIDPKLWDCGQTVVRDPNKVRVFWQGGISHYEDFWEIAEAIPEITAKYPQVHWVMMGAIWEHFWKDVPKDRYEYINWVHSEAYPYRMKLAAPDVAIAPLRDTVFNACKSSIKFYEYSALGAPTVASNVPPYSDDIWDGKNGFLASNPKEWVDKLSVLIEDSAERKRMASEAYRYVMRERSVEVVAPLIVKAMESYVSGKPLPAG